MLGNHIALLDSRPYGMYDRIPDNIRLTGVETKWAKGYFGKGVVVAVLDTGCDVNHPELTGRIIDGHNFTEDYGGDSSRYDDENGHGTHVAGVIASSFDQSGIVGLAPESSLLILKVLTNMGRGTVESLIKAIYFAVNWRGMNGEKVRVISLSLGLKKPDGNLRKAISYAINNEVSVVAASGNDGDGDIGTREYRYPGSYEEVIEVGAIDLYKDIAEFSNTNEYVDIYAPGVEVYSTTVENGYSYLSGTSMAAPHISACMALLIEEYETLLSRVLTEKEIYHILMQHTEIHQNQNSLIHIINLNRTIKFGEELKSNDNRKQGDADKMLL